MEALAADRPLPSQFGGVVGITSFGPLAVEAFLIPSASHLWDKWQFALDGIPPKSEETIELNQCQNALLVSGIYTYIYVYIYIFALKIKWYLIIRNFSLAWVNFMPTVEPWEGRKRALMHLHSLNVSVKS